MDSRTCYITNNTLKNTKTCTVYKNHNPTLRYVTIISYPSMLYCSIIIYNNLKMIFVIMTFIDIVVDHITGTSHDEVTATDEFYSKEMKDFLDRRKL